MKHKTNRSQRWLGIVLVLTLPAAGVFAWNADYSSEPLGDWVRAEGHNWIINEAFALLKSRDMLPDGLSERQLQYGVYFADSPWLGRAETFGEYPRSGAPVVLLQGRPGCTVDDHCDGTKENCVATSFMQNEKECETKWSWKGPFYLPSKKCKGGDMSHPNYYLRARWVMSCGETRRPNYAADTLSHYANDAKIRADGTALSESVIAESFEGDGPYRVKAEDYGVELYRMARRFWPGSASKPKPDLKDLVYVKEPGRILNSHWCVRVKKAYANLPATFLGGNPFVLTKPTPGSDDCPEPQKTVGYGPTWPIWVPDDFDGKSVKHRKLLALPEAEFSSRAAVIYLGWALHMLQDLSQPFHAADRTGEYHQDSEDRLDDLLAEGRFDHLPVLTQAIKYDDASAGRYRFSDLQVVELPLERLERQDLGGWCEEYLEAKPGFRKDFQEVKQAAKRLYSKQVDLKDLFVDPGNVFDPSANTSVGDLEYLLDLAVKKSAQMIACVGHGAFSEELDRSKVGYERYQSEKESESDRGAVWEQYGGYAWTRDLAVLDCQKAVQAAAASRDIFCELDGRVFGYELFWDGKRVGYEPAWTRKQGIRNCQWNIRKHGAKRQVSCKFDGDTLGYESLWLGQRVLYEPAWTREQAIGKCEELVESFGKEQVSCRFDGSTLGYELYWDGRRVGYRPEWTRERGIRNCEWSNDKHGKKKAVSCRFDGDPLGYKLFWDGRRVGYRPDWARDRGIENCQWNVEKHGKKKLIACEFDGTPLGYELYLDDRRVRYEPEWTPARRGNSSCGRSIEKYGDKEVLCYFEGRLLGKS